MSMSATSQAPRINRFPPVRLSAVNDATGQALPAWREPRDVVESTILGIWSDVLACESGNICSASYTFTFARVAEDTNPTLEMDWDVDVIAEYIDIARGPGTTPPPGSSIEVTITP